MGIHRRRQRRKLYPRCPARRRLCRRISAGCARTRRRIHRHRPRAGHSLHLHRQLGIAILRNCECHHRRARTGDRISLRRSADLRHRAGNTLGGRGDSHRHRQYRRRLHRIGRPSLRTVARQNELDDNHHRHSRRQPPLSALQQRRSRLFPDIAHRPLPRNEIRQRRCHSNSRRRGRLPRDLRAGRTTTLFHMDLRRLGLRLEHSQRRLRNVCRSTRRSLRRRTGSPRQQQRHWRTYRNGSGPAQGHRHCFVLRPPMGRRHYVVYRCRIQHRRR